jgi:LigT like Phosphoesterase
MPSFSTPDPHSSRLATRLTEAVARLFVAVWPPDEVLETLRAPGRRDRRGVRFVHPNKWHITVRFLGQADPATVAAALDRAAPSTCWRIAHWWCP